MESLLDHPVSLSPRLPSELQCQGCINKSTSVSSAKIWCLSAFSIIDSQSDFVPAPESKLKFLSYFGSPFSSWLPLPNCSHHGSCIQRSPSEGQRADSIWCSPSSTSNSHPRLSRVSIRFQNHVSKMSNWIQKEGKKECSGPL